MMRKHGMTARRVVIITNERGAADDSLSYMMGFVLSLNATLDIVIICNDDSMNKHLKGSPNTAGAIESIISTGGKYGFEVSIELYCKSTISSMRNDIENKKGLAMVLLSPALNNDRVFDLKTILKGVPVPVWQYRKRRAEPFTGGMRKGGRQHEQVKDDIKQG